MANISMKDGVWGDLGRFKSVSCKCIKDMSICTVEFEEGDLTLLKDELRTLCRRM